jgi:regulator of protease activity HflC (stomatin/prohibitin superfamily)
MKRESRIWLMGSLVAAFIILVLLYIFFGNPYTVSPFERAVIFNQLNGELDKENVIGVGTWFKRPWHEVIIYSVTENMAEESLGALDKDGNQIQADITVRFSLVPDKIGYLHESFGSDYKDVMVSPEIRSATREVLQQYSAEEIYSTKRSEVEIAIKNVAEVAFQRNYVRLNAFLIRSIKIPDQIRIDLEERVKALKEKNKK